MAQKTSELWQTLLRTPNTTMDYKFEIDGVTYGNDAEVSHSVENGLYDKFSIGNAACAKLTLTLYADNIPRGATIKRFVRLVNGEQVTEWLPKGVFFANRRSEEDGLWTVEAFDVMRKAELPWEPDQSLEFPMPMPKAAEEFARIMGCAVDPRTQLNAAYTIDYPTTDPESTDPERNNYTIRQILQWFAVAHAGNWIVTDEGNLLLLPIGSEPEETYYLIDEDGDAITFGGDRIIVR